MKACLQRNPPIKVIFERGTLRAWQWKEEDSASVFFFSLIGLKLSGRNCETINCFFYQGCTVWRRFSGGPPSLPATIFPSAFHSLCLSHFSINLHDLTLFIEPGTCLLQRTNKMVPPSPSHISYLFFFCLCLSLWLPSLLAVVFFQPRMLGFRALAGF